MSSNLAHLEHWTTNYKVNELTSCLHQNSLSFVHNFPLLLIKSQEKTNTVSEMKHYSSFSNHFWWSYNIPNKIPRCVMSWYFRKKLEQKGKCCQHICSSLLAAAIAGMTKQLNACLITRKEKQKGNTACLIFKGILQSLKWFP